MGASDYLANELVDHVLGTGAVFTPPTNIYASLHSDDPGTTAASASANELSGGAYTRVQHSAWNAASSGDATNNGVIAFPQATADWLEADHFGLWDAVTVGNFLGGGQLTPAKTVGNGDTAEFADQAMTVSMS